MERLTFNTGPRPVGPAVVPGRSAAKAATMAASASPFTFTHVRKRVAVIRERYDWDYLWMLAFTALLFLRPQDQIRALAPLHLAELTAVAGLAAMALRRMSAGQTIVTITPEVIGVLALGAVIVLTIPFSIWPGGSMRVFSDIYVKIILIFSLMISTLSSPRRLRQMTWLMILASGYLAGRGVLDYARGVNLVEGNRLRGAVGGMFANPNDLALNMVTFLAPTLFIVLQERRASRRLLAGGIAVLMLGCIVFTKSRSGFLGLVAMLMVVGYYMLRIKPGIIFAVLFAGLLALPIMPQSFWDRMDSITNAETDPTGSRAARIRLIEQATEVFVANPVTGIGAGQFVNYSEPGMVEKFRVTHNVWLQVAAELGIFGLMAFVYLVYRAFQACFATMRAIGPVRRRAAPPAWSGKVTPIRPGADSSPRAGRGGRPPFTDEERRLVDMNAKGMYAAMVGWFVCACFASVAFNWTFYYVFALAVAGREVASSRRTAHTVEPREPAGVPRLAASRA